jgi:hypothetical protein
MVHPIQVARRSRLWPLSVSRADRHVKASVKANAGNVGRKQLALMKSELNRMRGPDVDENVDIRVTRSGRSTCFRSPC